MQDSSFGRSILWLPIGSSIGMGAGSIIAVMTDQLALPISLGVAIGTGLGTCAMAISIALKRARQTDPDGPHDP